MITISTSLFRWVSLLRQYNYKKGARDDLEFCKAFKYWFSVQSVQSLSRVRLFATPWTIACQASMSFTNSQFTQTHVHWVTDDIQPSHPLSSPSPSAFNLSQHQCLFQWVSSYIMWPKYWSFSISPSNEYSELISFRMDWFDLLAVEGTLKSLLQHHSSKASILQSSVCFMAFFILTMLLLLLLLSCFSRVRLCVTA